MQRWSSKLRSAVALYPPATSSQPYPLISAFTPGRSLISTYSSNLATFSSFKSLINDPPFSHQPYLSSSPSSFFPLSLMQVRHITAKQKKRKLKSRQPMTPIVSKVKKTKMKAYSSFKGRFRIMKDGLIRCWREGKRHNATSKWHHTTSIVASHRDVRFAFPEVEPQRGAPKSKKARRRLRRPGTVPLAYAKVMKKLNFRG